MPLESEKFDAIIVQKPGRRRPQWSKCRSPYGQPLDIALSAMLKECRRGNEMEAIYWAHQMAISGTQAEQFMWDQMLIFAVEDIGPADPQVLQTVLASKQAYEQFEHGFDGKYIFVANAISACALSKKTRHVESLYALMLYRLRQGEPGPEVPDYAIDHHLVSGKRLGRDLKHYYEVASHLENEDMDFHVPTDELRKRAGAL